MAALQLMETTCSEHQRTGRTDRDHLQGNRQFSLDSDNTEARSPTSLFLWCRPGNRETHTL